MGHRRESCGSEPTETGDGSTVTTPDHVRFLRQPIDGKNASVRIADPSRWVRALVLLET